MCICKQLYIPANLLQDKMLDISWCIVCLDLEANIELDVLAIFTTIIFIQKEIFTQNSLHCMGYYLTKSSDNKCVEMERTLCRHKKHLKLFVIFYPL
jgi:hypothetical protein